MRHVAWLQLVCLVWSVGSLGCRSPYYADRGAALGGIAGGLAGAALGDRHGNAAGGAVLGGAVGALTGAAVGSSMDAEVERRQALIEARTGRRMAGRATKADVITLTQSGLSEDVIINHIRANGVAGELSPADIISLHDSGVSEGVITAMQQTAMQTAARDTPVVIREAYVVPPPRPPHMYYRWHGHPPRRPSPRPGVSWGVSFWN